jgi:hypothetical protein
MERSILPPSVLGAAPFQQAAAAALHPQFKKGLSDTIFAPAIKDSAA